MHREKNKKAKRHPKKLQKNFKNGVGVYDLFIVFTIL